MYLCFLLHNSRVGKLINLPFFEADSLLIGCPSQTEYWKGEMMDNSGLVS